MNITKLVLMCLVSSALVSCVPVVERIYRPEIVNGQLRETSCRYNSGPGSWDEIVFEKDKIEIRVHAFRIYNPDSTRISVSFLVPEGESVTLGSSDLNLFLVNSSTNLQMYAKESLWWHQDKMQKQSLMHPMVYRTEDSKKGRTRSNYGVVFDLPSATVVKENFEIRLPHLIIDGKHTDLPIIRFHYELNARFQSLNC